ncbi:MAG: type VI secretion system lipoprotein TssJ [Candidatus Zixiibacteriota bacterium]
MMRLERTVMRNRMNWAAATRIFVAAGMAGLLLMLSGCGWLFGKQRKDMVVTVEFTGSDSLNHNGEIAQAVQLNVYALKGSSRFMQGDVRAFFDPTFDPGFLEEFNKQDTLRTATVILAPKETRSVDLVIPFIRARDAKPVLGVIADFNLPPGKDQERLSLNLSKKTKQTIKINVGRNWVAKKGK